MSGSEPRPCLPVFQFPFLKGGIRLARRLLMGHRAPQARSVRVRRQLPPADGGSPDSGLRAEGAVPAWLAFGRDGEQEQRVPWL